MSTSAIPTSSSSLLALGSLTPPSPELFPDSSITSGNIPILLDGLSLHSSNSEHAFMEESNTVSDIFLDSSRGRDSVLSLGTFGRTSQDAICKSPSIVSDFEDRQTSRPPSLSPSPISRHFNLSPTFSRIRKSLNSSKMLASGSIGKLVPSSKSSGSMTMQHSETFSTLDIPVFSTPSYPVTPEITPPPTPSKRRNFFSTAVSNALARRSDSANGWLSVAPGIGPEAASPSPRSKGHSRGVSEQNHDLPRALNLPDSLAFLHDTLIEAHIDQEGFRSAISTFKLAGYSPLSRSIDTNYNDIPIAEFMPVTRQAFQFHYAPFETAPVLRRLTVVGLSSKDHLTREAAMSLKSNGVYTIRGAETSNLPPMFDVGDGKLRWKFEYMVTDRRNPGAKVPDGEKTMTPLLFACSPLLLHPLQGKKIRLIHVMRKSMIPSLVAEKMRPPVFGVAPLAQSTPAHPANNVSKSRVWNLHRRAQSHAVTAPRDNYAQPNVDQETCATVNAHKRSASSAGESSTTPTHKAPPLPLDRHILSRDRLLELMTLTQENEKHQRPFHVVENGLQALSPPPRPTHTRSPLPRSDGHTRISGELSRKT